MEKNDRRLVKFIVIIVLTAVVVETANYLIPIPTAGSVTVTDKIGDAHCPELLFMDIVEATVQKNEANINVTIKVNGDIPNQTESSGGVNVTYTYSFKAYLFENIGFEESTQFMNLDLEVDKWILKLGRSGYRHTVVDYAGEDFPGSFSIDQRGRMIQIILDLNFMREKDIWTNATSEPFSWFVSSEWEFRHVSGGSSGLCDGVSGYFPDYLSFLRRTHIPQLTLVSFIVVFLGGIVWWWIGVQALPKLQKQVKILGVIYRFHGILFLALSIFFLYLVLPPPGFYAYVFAGPIILFAFCLFLTCIPFFLAALGILRGERWARKFGLGLSTLAAVCGFLLLSMVAYTFYSGWLLDYTQAVIVLPVLIVGTTSLLCIYYLTRPNVKAYFKPRKKA